MSFARILTVALLVLVLSVLPGTADPVHPSGLSDRFAENRPYLNQTRTGKNATMSFDVHTGDLLTSPVHKEAKVISSVRLLIQVVNGTMSKANRTMKGSHAGSQVMEEHGDLEEHEEEEEGHEEEEHEEEEMEKVTDNSGHSADDDEIHHISDEDGARVNVSLGRVRDSTYAGNGKDSKKKNSSGSSYAGKRMKTTTETAADVSYHYEEDDEEEGEEDFTYECDCDETETGASNHSLHRRPKNGTGSYSHGYATTYKPVHHSQKEDLEHSTHITEEEKQMEKDRGEAYVHPKKVIYGSAVHVDDAESTSGTVLPPLRRRPTTKKSSTSGYTSTLTSADLTIYEKYEREHHDSDVDDETDHDSDEDEITEEKEDHNGASKGGKQPPVCFGDWTKWTGCKPINQTHSVRERVRFKLLSDADPVPEMNLQSQSCEDSELALIPGLLSEWSTWSVCTRTCDGGVESRFRSLIGSFTNGSRHEPLTETRPCGLKKCIRIVETPTFLGDWSQWSPCSRSCGGGIQTRYKQCILVSSAEYVSHPNLPVVDAVVIPKPRPIARHHCVTNTSLPTAGIELAGCAIVFCAGDLEVFDRRYESEVLNPTTLSPPVGNVTTSSLMTTSGSGQNGAGRLVPSEEHFDSDHDEVYHVTDRPNSPSYSPPPMYPVPYGGAPAVPNQPPSVVNYGAAPYPQAPPMGNYPNLGQVVFPGRPTNYSGPALQNMQPPVAPSYVNPPMPAQQTVQQYPQTQVPQNGNAPPRPMNVSRPSQQNMAPLMPSQPPVAAPYTKTMENLQAPPRDFPVLSAVQAPAPQPPAPQPPAPQPVLPQPRNLTPPGLIVQMPIVYDTVAPQPAASTGGMAVNGTTGPKVICVTINSTDSKSATAVQYNFINSTGRLLPPAVLTLSGAMRSSEGAPPSPVTRVMSPIAPLAPVSYGPPPAPVVYGPPPTQPTPVSYGPPPTQPTPVVYGPPPAQYVPSRPERMQQSGGGSPVNAAPAPAPAVAYQQQPPRYTAPVAAAPLDPNLMLHYREENQVDYNDYDERN